VHTLGIKDTDEESPLACKRCHRPVRWMITYQGGRPRAFDTEPCPPASAGWAPGQFLIGATLRYCMAPLAAFADARQASIACVLTVHECPPQTRTDKEAQHP
jgi:hypothetical protein